MLLKIPKQFFIFGLVIAILFSIPVAIFLHFDDYSQIWLMYLGNAIFLASIFLFLIFYGNHRQQGISPLNAGLYISGAAIVFAVLIVLICTFIFAPQIFQSGNTEKIHDAPAAVDKSSTGKVFFILLGSTILGNVVAGTFASVIVGAAIKKYRKPAG